MVSVLVLLSTYNGAKYIREQIDSLLKQRGVYVTAVVRDDGSTDETLSILEDYKNGNSNLNVYRDHNVGAARSFYQLLEYAINDFEPFDYYAFCDQDDVWLKDKLTVATTILDNISTPLRLYFSSASLVDSGLNEIQGEKIKIVNTLEANVASNRCLGCTMVFSRGILQMASSVLPFVMRTPAEKYVPLHDCWFALVAYSFGEVYYDEMPHILYRQHGRNVVGATSSIRKKIKILIKDFLEKKKERSSNCKLFVDIYGRENVPISSSIIIKASEYDTTLYNTIRFAFTPALYNFGFLRNMGLFFLIITRRF